MRYFFILENVKKFRMEIIESERSACLKLLCGSDSAVMNTEEKVSC